MSRKYIFTDKIHSPKGIMSTLIGLINVGSISYVVYKTFKAGGEAPDRYASTLVLALFMAFVGIILGLVGKSEYQKFYLFAYLGMVINIIAIGMISAILYAGAYAI